MDKEKIERFRKEFASIVYVNSEIMTNNLRLKSLMVWDKNSSHSKAILKNIEHRKELKLKLQTKLKGKTYDEWKFLSKKLSVLNSRLRNAINTKERTETEINQLQILIP